MLRNNIQNFLIVVLVIMVVVLASFFLIGFNRMTAQAQNEAASLILPASFDNEANLTIDKPAERAITALAYQGIFTDELSLLKGLDDLGEGSPLEQVSELKDTPPTGIGVESVGGGTEYVSSASFRHAGSSGQASDYFFYPLGGYIRNNGPNVLCLAAPVYLPDGATITLFRMFFIDSSATADMLGAVLVRHDLDTPGATSENMMDSFSPALVGHNSSLPFVFSSSLFESPPGSEVVSNSYGYSIIFCFNTGANIGPAGTPGLNHKLYGFNIDYTL